MGLFSTMFNVSSAMASRGRMRRAVLFGDEQNARSRAVVDVGRVSASKCVAGFEPDRDRVIVSGLRAGQHSLVDAVKSASLDRGLPVVSISFGVDDVQVRGQAETYDPLFGCEPAEAGRFLDAIGFSDTGRAGADFVRCVIDIDRKSGLQPSSLSVMRALESLEEVFGRLASLEETGAVSSREADRVQSSLMADEDALTSLRKIFGRPEGDMLTPGKSFSIRSSLRFGIARIAIPSAKSPELALACAEIESLQFEGRRFLLIIDGLDSVCPSCLLEVLGTHRPWALAAGDAVRVSGAGNLPQLVSLADGLFVLGGHSPVSSEEISSCLGDYEHIDVQVSRGGGGGFQGRVGYSRQATDTVTSSYRRERVISPDYIRGLRGNEFVLAPSGTGEVFIGTLS